MSPGLGSVQGWGSWARLSVRLGVLVPHTGLAPPLKGPSLCESHPAPIGNEGLWDGGYVGSVHGQALTPAGLCSPMAAQAVLGAEKKCRKPICPLGVRMQGVVCVGCSGHVGRAGGPAVGLLLMPQQASVSVPVRDPGELWFSSASPTPRGVKE